MTRITLWFSDARSAALLMGALLLLGCLTDDARKAPPPLVISPSSATQGELLPLILSAEGLDLKNCTDDPEFLIFKGKSSKESITVYAINDMVYEQSGTRAYISIDGDAPEGEYDVTFACNETTTLEGTFRVDLLPTEMSLDLSKPILSAGTFEETVILSTEYPFFTEDTELLFGSGNEVVVTYEKLLSDTDIGDELEIHISIDPMAPLGEMPVTAVSGKRVATGTLTVTDRIEAVITVTPSEVERQVAGESIPRIYDLTIEGEGIAFVEPDPEQGIDEDDATRIDFPENAGISVINELKVVEIVVDGETVRQIHAQIRINDLAKLGGTPLHLATGEREAWTQLTVLLPENTAYLDIVTPKSFPKNGKPTSVFAEAINFNLEHFDTLECEEDGCDVSNRVVDQNTFKKISFDVTVDETFSSEKLTLVLKTKDDIEVKTQQNVTTPDAVQLTLRDPDKVLHQGNRKEDILFVLSGAVFPSDTKDVTVKTLPRSGVRINPEPISFNGDKTVLTVWFDVAEDAPIGPAYVLIKTSDMTFEMPVPVEPLNLETNTIICSPGATLRKRGVLLPRITATGFTLPSAVSGYAFDDPGFQVVGIRTQDDGSVILNVNVSPKIRPDMAVLYVKGEDGQAATTFRILDYPTTRVLSATPSVVNRGDKQVSISVQGEGVQFNTFPTVELAENIGLGVSRIGTVQNRLLFDLQLDDVGFGGFTGLVIRDSGRSYLSLLDVKAGQDTTLTAKVQPPLVYPLSQPQPVEVSLPTQMTLDESMLDVHVDLEGTFAAEPRPSSETSDRKVSFYLDVSYDVLDVEATEIPIYVTTAKGAAVAFLPVAKESSTEIMDGEVFSGDLTPGQARNFNVLPGTAPTFVQIGFSGEEGTGSATLISSNNLDIAQQMSNGGLWILDDAKALVAVTADEEDNPVHVSVKSIGHYAALEDPNSDLIEDPNEEGGKDDAIYGWTLWSDDPCETPFLGVGAISGALDSDIVDIGNITCELVAAVYARSIADRAWETPDLRMSQLDENGAIQDENSGYPTLSDMDPRLFLQEGTEDARILLDAELSSAGSYIVNIRRPHLIRELSREEKSFVELLIGPSDYLADLSLTLVDADENVEVASLSLSDADITDPGIVVISSSAMAGSDVVHPVALLPRPGEGAFALILKQGETVIDAVQVGTGRSSHGEGSPINANLEDEIFLRVGDLDSNDNESDFIVGFSSTPGL